MIASSPRGHDPTVRRVNRQYPALLRWLCALGACALLACRPSEKGPSAPGTSPASASRTKSPSGNPGSASQPQPSPAAEPQSQSSPPGEPRTSLRLSTLPADTMALARIRGKNTFQTALATALETPPASLARSLPLALRLPLSMLTLASSQRFPFDQLPRALVWDAKQRTIWIWDQQDLSLAGRNAIEQALGATTSFSPPYWIHQRPGDPLEYFVHTKARWLIACPKSFAPEIRTWLKDARASKPGRLAWAPTSQDLPALVVRWRYPQILESAPEHALGIVGELVFTPEQGVLVNGASRSTP